MSDQFFCLLWRVCSYFLTWKILLCSQNSYLFSLTISVCSYPDTKSDVSGHSLKKILNYESIPFLQHQEWWKCNFIEIKSNIEILKVTNIPQSSVWRRCSLHFVKEVQWIKSINKRNGIFFHLDGQNFANLPPGSPHILHKIYCLW